jgi:hypothetical protein
MIGSAAAGKRSGGALVEVEIQAAKRSRHGVKKEGGTNASSHR